MRAVGYVRVSTEEQVRQGISLDAQRERIRLYANLYDVDIVEVYGDEGSTGYKLGRRGLQASLGAIEDGDAEAIIISQIDRLSRNLEDFLYLLSKYFMSRYVLMSVSEQLDCRTPTGKFALTILAAVAQLQLETTRERTKGALDYKRRRQEYIGGEVPYGWARGEGDKDKLVMVPSEQLTIANARELRSQGLTLRAIGKELISRGCFPRKGGGGWAPNQIKRLLRDVVPMEVLSEQHDKG